MYYYNGFVCGGRPDGQIRITDVKVLPDRIMILTFRDGIGRASNRLRNRMSSGSML